MAEKTMATFRLTPSSKQAVGLLAEKLGLSQTAVVEQAIRAMAKKEKIDPKPPRQETDLVYLMTRPMAEREAALEASAIAAAELYAEDLALPVEERELTAFTALDGEPFLDDDFDMEVAADVR
jgi:hypothetical protein